MPRVTTIPATKNKFTTLPTASICKRRTAGYARVSTDSDEQFTSYEAQIDYYTKLITSREDWAFVDVYTDVDTPYGRIPDGIACNDCGKNLGAPYFLYNSRSLSQS